MRQERVIERVIESWWNRRAGRMACYRIRVLALPDGRYRVHWTGGDWLDEHRDTPDLDDARDVAAMLRERSGFGPDDWVDQAEQPSS